MNAIDRLLHDQLTGVVDRLASSVPEGSVDRVRVAHPTLTRRLDEMEATLAGLRAGVLEAYGKWRSGLDDLENLWALVAWRSAESEEAAEKAPALAA